MNINIPAEFVIKLLQLDNIGRAKALKIISSTDYFIESDRELITAVQGQSGSYNIPHYNDYDFENAFRKADQIISRSEKQGIKFITYWDNEYPELLKGIKDFPIILNFQGNLKSLSELPTLAIIGTRRPSNYGSRYGQNMAKKCAEKGFNIVSGLAVGCDSAGHLGALDANGITTAVLAHGLDTVYPAENKYLAEKIISNNGLLISEYFIGKRGLPNYFVERDRIQAGLSLGTIVIETDIKGGTMHTVNYTLENDRILGCVDFLDDSGKFLNNEGNKMLIRQRKAIPIYYENQLYDFLELLNTKFYIAPKKEEKIGLENKSSAFEKDSIIPKIVDQEINFESPTNAITQPEVSGKEDEIIFNKTRLADITKQLEQIKVEKRMLNAKEKKLAAEKKSREDKLAILLGKAPNSSNLTDGKLPL